MESQQVSCVSYLQNRPTFHEIVDWIDFDTVCSSAKLLDRSFGLKDTFWQVGVLFGMMLMVGILSRTGIFEYCAIRAYKVDQLSFRFTTKSSGLMGKKKKKNICSFLEEICGSWRSCCAVWQALFLLFWTTLPPFFLSHLSQCASVKLSTSAP